MNKILIAIIGLAVLGGVGWYVMNTNTEPVENKVEEFREVPEALNTKGIDSVVVVSTADGYEPKEFTISVGDELIFRNESDRDVWTATDIHPQHRVYPGSDIQRCFSGESKEGLFDSCKGIAPGEEWGFQVMEAGEWGFHDHLRANHKGKVIVK